MRRPALVVRAADAADVARTVTFARQSGLELAVRGGGHSLAGHSTGDDVLLLDLSPMKGLHIDPGSRLVRAQPGLTAGEVADALAAHGLAIPFGDTASVGIAGLTLGGGIGYLVRKHGLAIDSLVAVEVVTADGRIVTASEHQHQDHRWAIRGGGGNFGVVTRFVYRASPLGMTLAGGFGVAATVDAVSALVELAEAAPEELTVIAFVMAAPALPSCRRGFGRPRPVRHARVRG